ncbi:MAG TPA: T9SS type A sorting domain-containing protein [Bacteroidia bacterium]
MLVLSLKVVSQSPEWAPAGMPLHGRQIRCIYNDTTDNVLYVAGEIMATSTSFSTQFICKYDGSVWNTIGVFNGQVLSVTNYNGDLIVSGFFTMINGVPIYSIARYNGGAWYSMGNVDEAVFRVKVINSELYALGGFNTIDGTPAKRIAKWNGNAWSDVYNFFTDTMDGLLFDVAIYKGNTYVCGNFENSALGVNHVAVYKGGSWQNVGGGIQGSFTSLEEFAEYRNELYIAGSIIKPDGNAGHMIQKWNDTIWSEVGGSVQDLNGGNGFATIRDLLVYDNELYVAGGFGYAGSIPATFIAKWDGLQWCGFATHDLFTDGAGAQTGNAIGFYNDTMYLGIGNDTLNGVHTNRIIKYTAGNYVDTCSIQYTNINILISNNNIFIYPNPATNTIIVEFESITSKTPLQIKNVLGQTIQSFTLNGSDNKVLVDINEYPPGVYFILLQNEGKTLVKKFIKE